jgi:uncharacterized protein
VDAAGQGSFDRVMQAIEMMKAHGVEFNTLTMIHKRNARRGKDVYRFLRKHGSNFMQFIPLVERPGAGPGCFAPAPGLREVQTEQEAVPESATPGDFGAFYCAVFDEWVRNDVGQVYVRMFDVQLGNWIGRPGALCVFAESCGLAVALEHNGDLYACDHFVYPEYRLGNILETPLSELVESAEQQRFGAEKRDALPKQCRECDVLFACRGGCPKHRFRATPDGAPGLNYLCEGYRKFFRHIDSCMQTMGRLLQAGRPPAEIMQMLAKDGSGRGAPGRNTPCPCGSGRKYRKCCGRG